MPEALLFFERWSTWMWANEEVVDLTRWLRTRNAGVDESERVRFHGLDVYSLWESLREILTYLSEHDPEQVPAALAACRCFEPYEEDAQQYAPATRARASCGRTTPMPVTPVPPAWPTPASGGQTSGPARTV